jgi:hypothetical protein
MTAYRHKDFFDEIEEVKQVQVRFVARELRQCGVSQGEINDILWEAGDALCHPMSERELERWAARQIAPGD